MRHVLNPIEVESRSASQDWSDLQPGDVVHVADLLGRFSGVVDEKADDSRFLWVIRDGPATRHVYGNREETRIIKAHLSRP